MLNKLPDEIVVNIVERYSEPRPFACASLFAPSPHDSKPYEALKWSHLSKHHRVLMRGTASLWTWISSDMHPALIQECLQLSSDLALDVEISAKHTETDSLQALLHPPSSTRWSSPPDAYITHTKRTSQASRSRRLRTWCATSTWILKDCSSRLCRDCVSFMSKKFTRCMHTMAIDPSLGSRRCTTPGQRLTFAKSSTTAVTACRYNLGIR